MKSILGACGVLVVLIGAWFAADYLALFSQSSVSTPEPVPSDVPYIVETFVTGLEVPWSIAWTSPTRMLVTERPGRIRLIEDGVLRAEPLYAFDDVSVGGEEGLMGLAVSPDYAMDSFVYASYAYEVGRDMFVRVVRLEDRDTELVFDKIIIDAVPAAQYHAGSRIEFGPDGMLYVTTGDATDRELAQDDASLVGKTLRMTPEGAVPLDNPTPGSYVWSKGHRNAQGLTWHPETGVMYQSEHGPSVFDGPAGGDEVNRFVAGGNYGWPRVSHEEVLVGTVAPLTVFTPAKAPGSLLAYSGDAFPQFYGNLFLGALRGEALLRIVLSEDGTRAQRIEEIVSGMGRIRAVAEGPDGAIYFSSSNRDGRGTVRDGDDRIMRIVPAE